ncbi:MAG TPA: DUF1549 and DUF1553 domain-containing protein, partial [Cellvibrionaceae bacterium]|nr:DUF1549 and DUF1553 domain-containing protein [Cellvibrionaceae bacterium]
GDDDKAADDKGADAKAAVSKVPNNWAYKPVASVAPPEVKRKDWVSTPIDNFILAKLEEKNIKPSPETERGNFIRRATLDAWGVLPSPEDVEAFEKDRSSDAYEKLVDRLLASPHFGERQARRWLDLARYADSAGFQNDQTRPNTWRYRDYVINAFNDNKPFDQFIREQLAGDELFPDNQDAKIATGFLALYPDNYNSRDLVQRKYQIETDITDLVGETFLASTIGCARCHNHKIDKISQKEYFQLQAFFANLIVNEKTPVLKGTETQAEKDYAQAQAAYQEATKDIRAKQKALLDPIREKARKYHNERYLTDSRESIFKPEKDWTPLDRWVNYRTNAVASERDIVAYLKQSATEKDGSEFNAANIPRWEEYEKLTAELKKFDSLKPIKGSSTYTSVTELGPIAPPTRIRFTGIHEKPLDEVQPGLPALWAGDTKLDIVPTAKTTGRRTALANWLASNDNPLTPRVYVNRVWAQYFAKGIAANPGDFGRAGPKPTHPELLDYLAGGFVKDGWNIKNLHRQILLSSTYRQSSEERADVQKVDPDNSLLAVYPRKRLEAEEIRDALLSASGKLDDTVGGPSVFPQLPPTVVVANTLNNNGGGLLWETSKDPKDFNRRSIYTFVRRSLPYPLTASFDPADPSHPHHKREVSTTALQALTLFNSDVVVGWSQALAGRILDDVGTNESDAINRLYEILFARKATSSEKSLLKDFWKKQEKTIEAKAWTDKFEVAVPTGVKEGLKLSPVKAAAFVDLVHTVANSNEFAYRF